MKESGLLGCICCLCDPDHALADGDIWSDLRLSARASTGLRRGGLRTIADAKAAQDRDLLSIPGFGEGSLSELRWAILAFEGTHGQGFESSRRIIKWGMDRDSVKYTLAWFPHVTQNLLEVVATEWDAFGSDDADRRGISQYDWLWRRSRHLAAAGYV
jgi:hypothetical protein